MACVNVALFCFGQYFFGGLYPLSSFIRRMLWRNKCINIFLRDNIFPKLFLCLGNIIEMKFSLSPR